MEVLQNITKIIAIDAGANGGIAIYTPNTPVRVFKMPKVENLHQLIEREKQEGAICFLERLTLRPDDAVGGNIGKALRVQKMLANYEHIKAVFAILHIPVVLVTPVTWQTRLQLRAKGYRQEKRERKNMYKKVAQDWYRDIKVTLWSSDALLILTFARYCVAKDEEFIKAHIIKN